VQRRQLPDGTNVRPAEHAVAHLLHLRADGRAVLCRRNHVRGRADVQRRPRHVPVLPTVKRRSLIVTCAQCRDEVLEADQIRDEEECLLREASHPKTAQPETRSVMLRLFVVTERPSSAA
jgi:hypothetical protein